MNTKQKASADRIRQAAQLIETLAPLERKPKEKGMKSRPASTYHY